MGKYLKRLTETDINNFLKANNYILCETLKDNDGQPLPGMSRSDDLIFLRCQRILDEGEQEIDKAVAYALMKKFKGFITMSMLSRFGEYSTEIDLITLSDFDANLIAEDIFINPQRAQDIYESYINFMLSKFKDENYRQDLIADYESNSNSTDMNL